MKQNEFKRLKELCKDRKTVENNLAYEGYLFLQLTNRQINIIAEILKDTGFPVVDESRSMSGKAVQLPSGIRLYLEK